MGLLQALGLPTAAPASPPEAPGGAPNEEFPSRSDGPGPTPPAGAKPKRRVSAPPVAEMAQWPSKAHRAWKRLDRVRQSAVAVQMASRYGEAFAKDFLAAAKSGRTKLEGAHFVTALASQTPEAMESAGYKLAQYASNGDRAQEWWVRADGFEVFLLRVVTSGTTPPSSTGPGVSPQIRQPSTTPPLKPPVGPPGTCNEESREYLDMALKWAETAMTEAMKEEAKLEASKREMETMKIVSAEFKKAYDAMTQQLEKEIAELESVIGDVLTAKDALQDSGCDLSKLDTAVDNLAHELTGFKAEKDLHEMDARKPANPEVKDVPDDDDDDDGE